MLPEDSPGVVLALLLLVVLLLYVLRPEARRGGALLCVPPQGAVVFILLLASAAFRLRFQRFAPLVSLNRLRFLVLRRMTSGSTTRSDVSGKHLSNSWEKHLAEEGLSAAGVPVYLGFLFLCSGG